MLPLNISFTLNKQIIENIKSGIQKFLERSSKPEISGTINSRKYFVKFRKLYFILVDFIICSFNFIYGK